MSKKDPEVTILEEPASHPTRSQGPLNQASPEQTRNVGKIHRPEDRIRADQPGSPNPAGDCNRE